MQQGVAKFADFMPEQPKPIKVEVFGKTDGKNCKVYLPATFKEKRCEIIPDFQSGKMLISILPKNYDGGVATHLAVLRGSEKAYASFGKKWWGGKDFKIISKEYDFDGKKIVVEVEPYTPVVKSNPPASEPETLDVPVEEIIKMNDSPKKIATACVRQLNKFADEYGYRFVVTNNRVSMVPDEVIE